MKTWALSAKIDMAETAAMLKVTISTSTSLSLTGKNKEGLLVRLSEVFVIRKKSLKSRRRQQRSRRTARRKTPKQKKRRTMNFRSASILFKYRKPTSSTTVWMKFRSIWPKCSRSQTRRVEQAVASKRVTRWKLWTKMANCLKWFMIPFWNAIMSPHRTRITKSKMSRKLHKPAIDLALTDVGVYLAPSDITQISTFWI